ncbi:DNA/RNA-binding domain of Phe-tRNA-synthetase-like protein [Paenibacillus shirakamiensis]|uniref:DNA/RNA-binding domain of Phe-tRNA-synthetase-like protein n=1 Tax=Paenibacillus shirakamiensis TaxID=1265935 RepID=A0ABS4JEW9_9BACL|nr:phenylalanine--tRNA ligase beta subunit-related protein [Paenibacillus shirakamiensis]MBP2000259.1 DNA/RNA-binding domain of Phe-tRNA-synthetase-like protein [Paenibacillus shirakamiensis]
MYSVITMSPKVEQDLQGVKVFGVHLELTPKKLESLVDYQSEWDEIHATWRGKSKAEVAAEAMMAAYQQFYQHIGINPKKYPPSVQNLIQRFFIKEELPRLPLIHPIVDAVNVAALQHLIPLGIFDAECVTGDIHLTITEGGEAFQGLGEAEPEALPEGLLVLSDEVKTLSRFCYRDSEVQKVTDSTHEVWLLGCQVPGVTEEQVIESLNAALSLLKRGYETHLITVD